MHVIGRGQAAGMFCCPARVALRHFQVVSCSLSMNSHVGQHESPPAALPTAAVVRSIMHARPRGAGSMGHHGCRRAGVMAGVAPLAGGQARPVLLHAHMVSSAGSCQKL